MEFGIDTWKVKAFTDNNELNIFEEITDYINNYEE